MLWIRIGPYPKLYPRSGIGTFPGSGIICVSNPDSTTIKRQINLTFIDNFKPVDSGRRGQTFVFGGLFLFISRLYIVYMVQRHSCASFFSRQHE